MNKRKENLIRITSSPARGRKLQLDAIEQFPQKIWQKFVQDESHLRRYQ